MATLQQAFGNTKLTENGDIAYTSTGNNLLDMLFMSEYFQKHLNHVGIGTSEREKLFSMFMRDPRYGIGLRDLGRELMKQSEVDLADVVKAGRFDDIFSMEGWMPFLRDEILAGNELAKKWAPRYSSKNLMLAREFAKFLGMNKQQYGKFVKVNTVEKSLSDKETDGIVFEHVPSLAMIKYYNRFIKGKDTSERFKEYLSDVKSGKKELKVSTTTVYDIYRNMDKIDPDLFFDKIEKIAISCVPVVDTSGSMWDMNDSIGKALSIGHYLAKCSTFAPNQVVSFSSRPQLITLGSDDVNRRAYGMYEQLLQSGNGSSYAREIASMYTGDCSNTDFAAVMDLFKSVDTLPEYIVVLSDMEFDRGSYQSKNELRNLWRVMGYTTKIVWWNFNSRSTTCPEIDADGNIFISGYNPMLLQYLEAGFDGEKFLDKLLDVYKEKIAM
jgi:hypothetical protein